MGWRVIVIWECQTNNPLRLLRKLKRELGALRRYKLPKYRNASLAAEQIGKYKSKPNCRRAKGTASEKKK
jgi:hypothetical protein